MLKIVISLVFLFLFALPSFAQNVKVQGIASKGGKIVRTSPAVQHVLMETYPSCTITVYQTGTLTLASIFTNEVGTPKSNPFTVNSDASWSFYIAPGRYDLQFSGTGILTPFTLSDVFIESGGGGGGGSVTSVFGRTGDVVYQIGDVPFTGLNFVGSNFNLIETRSASDLNAGTLPNAVFPAILPAISGINLTSLNASNIASGTLSDARLSTNVPLKNTVNVFTQDNIFNTNVGINTATPRRRLDVLDGSNAQLRLSAVDNSVYTDLFVDSGGSLNIFPTGNVAFDSTGNQVNPLNNFDQNLGQINKKWLSLHAAELFVETLVAQNTIATIGGRIIVAPSNILIADLSAVAVSISVKYNNLNNGDRIYMEGNNSVEFMAVTSGASVIAGGFSYSVTRNLDGTGANEWFAGDAMVNTGVSGNGFIDLYSLRGVKAATQIGPTIVGNVRNSTTFNDWSENWAIGNLNGIYGYGSDTHGVAFGKYNASNQHLTIDATNGIRFFEGLSTITSKWDSTGITIGQPVAGQSNIRISSGALILRNSVSEFIRLNSDGSGFLANSQIFWTSGGVFTVANNAFIGGWDIDPTEIKSGGIHLAASAVLANNKIYIGQGNYNNIDTSFFVDGNGRFSLKDKLTWDGTTLTVNGGGTFSGALSAASGTFTGSLSAATGTFAGSLSAATGTFSGSLSAATGTFSGDLTGSSMLLTGKLTVSGASGAIAIGTIPPTSCTSGTGIFISNVALCAVNADVNNVKIDHNGITLANTGTFTQDVLTFQFGGTNAGFIRATNDGSIRILGNNPISTVAQVLIQANETTNSRDVNLILGTTSSNTSASLFGDDFGGLVVGASAVSPLAMLDVRSDKIRISTAKTPATATEACAQGTIAWDANFIYVCVATDTWKRSGTSTW